VAMELQTESQRLNETLFSFEEFQGLAEMDCQSRYVSLLKWTIALHEEMQAFHSDILGVSGLYLQLLQQIPDENTWIWLLGSSHERIVQKLGSYWARIVALALDQHGCLLKELREVLLSSVVRWKGLHTEFMEMHWNIFAFGRYMDTKSADAPSTARQLASTQRVPQGIEIGNAWTFAVREWFEGYASELLKVLQSMEAQGTVTLGDTVRLHHQDEQGSFVTYEFLRRKVFGQWAIDKGLLRGLLRHVWQPPRGEDAPVTVGDFGAGGGHYSTWMNETGLIQAFAFDGTANAAALTGGVVQELNLVEDMHLWRTFDWVLCLEVGEHIPKQFAKGLLQNLARHARHGLVMSWSDDWEGIGHVNCLKREEFVAFVQAETGFVLDAGATQRVKDGCEIDYIARTIAVFRAPSR